MNVRQWKRLMRFGAILTGTVAVATLLFGLLLPVDVPVETPRERAVAASTQQTDTPVDTPGHDSPNIAALRQLCSLHLRRPLYDEPTPETPREPPSAPKATLAIRLLGTVQEPGHSMAMIQRADGMIEVYAEGDRVEDSNGVFTVVVIDADKVTVEKAGRTHVLVLPKVPDGELR